MRPVFCCRDVFMCRWCSRPDRPRPLRAIPPLLTNPHTACGRCKTQQPRQAHPNPILNPPPNRRARG
jgi:hypothetical protein